MKHFFPNTVNDGEFCPDWGRTTSVVKEESYFLNFLTMDKLLEHYENADFIMPRSRANSCKLVKGGLRDLP